MIEVTRLNGNPMMINSDLIKSAEASPDTVLTLVNGEKMMIRENPPEVIEKIIVYRARLLAALTAQSASGDLFRAVALASHNPDAGRPSTRITPVAGPTLVISENHSPETSL